MPVRIFFVVQLLCWCFAATPAAGQERAAPTAEESRLVSDSRAAVIAAGLSPEFFDAHFRLEQVFDRPADRRVVWRLRVGEHEAVVSDPVGSYTDERGVRRDTHSVSNLLGSARDIRETITRRRAERLMRACIGRYRNGAVVYQPFGSPPRATLVFTAVSLPEPQKTAAPPPQTGAHITQSAQSAPAATTQTDVTARPGKKKPLPPRVGMLDLETGRCIVGVGQSGSPHPDAEKLMRPPR